MSEPIARQSSPDQSLLKFAEEAAQQSREYWELEGSPAFDMRSGRIERHDVTRSFICRREAIPTLVEDALNDRLPWGQGPSYSGEIIGVRLHPIGPPEGPAGTNVATYSWWQVDLLYGSTVPTLLTKTRITERLQVQLHPSIYPVDLNIYTYAGGKFHRVASAAVFEGVGAAAVRYSVEIRNAAFFDARVLAMMGTVNATPLVTIAHGVIAPRCALFLGADTAITVQLGLLPRWNVQLEWLVKPRPWDVPVGLESYAGNLWVKVPSPASTDYYVPLLIAPGAEHNAIFNSFSW